MDNQKGADYYKNKFPDLKNIPDEDFKYLLEFLETVAKLSIKEYSKKSDENENK